MMINNYYETEKKVLKTKRIEERKKRRNRRVGGKGGCQQIHQANRCTT